MIYTVERRHPYKVEATKLRIADGKNTWLVFGQAAQKPFGKVKDVDKHKIGLALRGHIYG